MEMIQALKVIDFSTFHINGEGLFFLILSVVIAGLILNKMVQEDFDEKCNEKIQNLLDFYETCRQEKIANKANRLMMKQLNYSEKPHGILHLFHFKRTP
jgi:hypothetical protein